MQVLKSLYKCEDIDGSVKDFIERVDDIIKYMRNIVYRDNFNKDSCDKAEKEVRGL